MGLFVVDNACKVFKSVFEALKDVVVLGEGSIVCVLIEINEFYSEMLMFFGIIANQQGGRIEFPTRKLHQCLNNILDLFNSPDKKP